MCGIAGVVTPRSSDDLEPRAAVARMVRALAHRGPDGTGLVDCALPPAADGPRAVLGHTRLAIIDLSARAAQPMASPRRPMWLTFNGEIYNFADIRRDLEARGRRFESDSDSEVILQGFEEWGRAVIPRLRGMFAFALWDGERGELTLARDRFGIKPLYVHQTATRLVFASEVRALLASGLTPRRLDRQALDLYLRYQTVPTPRTLIDGVRMMPPGTAMTMRAGGRGVPEPYWDLLDAVSPEAARDDLGTRASVVRDLLREAAALHLVSDVPVGVFLSGGIDSSALVSLVRAAGQRPRTFAVALAGTPQDETRYARAVARAFDADHCEIPLDEEVIVRQLPEALAAVDHPSGDGINTYVVSRAVREAGVKVALSGLGGDELFGGYPSFDRLARLPAYADFWRWTPPAVRRAAAAAVRSIGRESVAAVKAAAVIESDGTVPGTFPVLRELFSRDQRASLLGAHQAGESEPDPYAELLAEAAARGRAVDVMALVSYAEARTYMHDVLLRDTDQMSMCHGLEVRVPLLDHRLAEYVVGLPSGAKIRTGRSKPLLVDSLDLALPPAGVDRPKQGFVLPFDRWMRGALRPLCEQHLGRDGLAGRGLLEPKAVDALWARFLARSPQTTWSRVWTLVALDAWLERTGVSP
jgi:asparagine synthase (glutamine-hydrolysing)